MSQLTLGAAVDPRDVAPAEWLDRARLLTLQVAALDAQLAAQGLSPREREPHTEALRLLARRCAALGGC